MPASRLGWLNYFSHWFSTQVFWHAGNLGYYQLRQRAPEAFPSKVYWPFQPTPGRPITPLIFTISPTVLAKPTDWKQPHIHMPGYNREAQRIGQAALNAVHHTGSRAARRWLTSSRARFPDQ